MKMVERTPALLAAYATPCAWFPAEAATTPWERSRGPREWILLSAPRTLNDPVRWKFSSFRWKSLPVSALRLVERLTGVRRTRGLSSLQAASTSAKVKAAVVGGDAEATAPGVV